MILLHELLDRHNRHCMSAIAMRFFLASIQVKLILLVC